MAASSLMTLGVRAMAANYAALQVTGHNIANASVPGYSRQRAELATAGGQFSGAGYFGKGVDVETIVRTHNAFLTREARATASLASMDEARLAQLRQLESVFPTGERGLGHAASLLANALADLANRPDDLSAREVVLARARDLAARLAGADAQLATLQQGTREELDIGIAKVNQLTRSIAEVNHQIAGVKGLGQPPNDLLDRRDQLLAELSQHIDITTVAADDGTVGVFAGGGQRLVLGNEAQPLAVVDDPQDASRAAIAIMDNGIPLRLRESALGGGSLAGLLRFQNEDLVQAQLQLGQMAAAVTGAYNAQHGLGVTLDGAAGGELFSAPLSRAVPAAGNARDAGGAFVGQVGIAITVPAALQASEYRLEADPAGGWRLTRLSDGLVRNVADGDEVDGFRIDIGAPAPAAGDSFLLQPVTRAASGLSVLIADPRALAAAGVPPDAADNGNALALAALRDGLLVDGSSATDAYAALLADIGVRVQGAQTSADLSTALAAQAEQMRSAETGVNLDEEAARLIEFQQSYQAAAKVLQVAQQVFDTLLEVTRG
jgi:flagellar hook-associated protein 1 FlgK